MIGKSNNFGINKNFTPSSLGSKSEDNKDDKRKECYERFTPSDLLLEIPFLEEYDTLMDKYDELQVSEWLEEVKETEKKPNRKEEAVQDREGFFTTSLQPLITKFCNEFIEFNLENVKSGGNKSTTSVCYYSKFYFLFKHYKGQPKRSDNGVKTPLIPIITVDGLLLNTFVKDTQGKFKISWCRKSYGDEKSPKVFCSFIHLAYHAMKEKITKIISDPSVSKLLPPCWRKPNPNFFFNIQSHVGLSDPVNGGKILNSIIYRANIPIKPLGKDNYKIRTQINELVMNNTNKSVTTESLIPSKYTQSIQDFIKKEVKESTSEEETVEMLRSTLKNIVTKSDKKRFTFASLEFRLGEFINFSSNSFSIPLDVNELNLIFVKPAEEESTIENSKKPVMSVELFTKLSTLSGGAPKVPEVNNEAEDESGYEF